jgi:hypothetical protein
VYRLYALGGEYAQFSLGPDAAELGVLEARIHPGGLVAMTGAYTFLEVRGWDGAKALVLANPSQCRTHMR